MSLDELSDLLKLTSSLMEIIDENPYKINAYKNASFNIDKINFDLSSATEEEISQINGIGKSIVQAIIQYRDFGTFEEYEKIKAKVPEGLADLLSINGLGPKKIKILWKDLQISNKNELLKACKANILADAKGFGFKTQKSIQENILFELSQQGKLRLNEAEVLDSIIVTLLEKYFTKVSLTGDYYRKDETIDCLEYVVIHSDKDFTFNPKVSFFSEQDSTELTYLFEKSSPYCLVFKWNKTNTELKIYLSDTEKLISETYILGASQKHLQEKFNNSSLLKILNTHNFKSENEIFEQLTLPYIAPTQREGTLEWELARENKIEQIKYSDLKGPLHNHSTWSDGKNTLSEIVEFCKSQKWEYMGISDHSQSATYAGGLEPEKILSQHKEIDQLNSQNGGFKIFKGIESDILADGSLDYTEDILKLFDYIVASVHSGLQMDEEKATVRLIKAIENPYTSILGHPTGRLLLKRKGYSINYKKVIDACAANNVAIEINSNPWRLDLSWHYVHYAQEKGVKIAICPDAHENSGFYDMKYGILMAQKGFLTKENCINTYSKAELERYFKKL
ncbi:MAG: PHP domain-containing protein [Cytophagales bacterium]